MLEKATVPARSYVAQTWTLTKKSKHQGYKPHKWKWREGYEE